MQPGESIVCADGLILGRGEAASVSFDDTSISRRHAELRAEDSAWTIHDLGSRTGSFVNGRLVQSASLVFGDLIQIGSVVLRFDGRRLGRVASASGAHLLALDLVKSAGPTTILDHISLEIPAGEFVGLIGPSGAGKSSLLDALCHLRPADSGSVRIDGVELGEDSGVLRDAFGYVPQDDIVPLELTVREALDFSARLRLPRDVPAGERRRLVHATLDRLGLTARADIRVARLSGGQRKRVSVAAELLTRPRLLFLDEPTSGLDPAAEFRLMEQLRQLAGTGCTVVCTTHVLENAHLMDRILILSSGRLVYEGAPSGASTAFLVPRLIDVYLALDDGRDPSEAPRQPEAAGTRAGEPVARPNPPRRAAAFPILLAREWAVLRADWKNLLLLIGQPVGIGVLVTWVTSDPALILFFAIVSTLWFGCGNAAQEIVRELPILRRERLVGLGRIPYLAAKFTSLARMTVLQALLLYGCMAAMTGGIGGAVGWQIPALVGTALAATAIGLAVSAWSRTVLQAVMVVPLILIPQILFSGFIPSAGDMRGGPYAVSVSMPSAAALRVMDVSLLWNQTISGAVRVDFPSAFSNLNRDRSLRNGEIYRTGRPAWTGLGALGAWTLGALVLAWAGIRSRERG